MSASVQHLCAKACYTKRQAREVLNRRTRGRRSVRHNRPKELRMYECPDCGGWHLTHKPFDSQP